MATETRQGFRLPWTAGTAESDEPTTNQPEGQGAMGDPPAEEGPKHEMIETVATTEPSGVSEGAGPATVRRATKFMADLSRAMQAAAEQARSETMARFEVDAKGVVEAIHSSATGEAADLRRKADDDVAAVREWSKAEIARVREETEARIAGRKSGLDSEMELHAATVEARTERVAAVVAAFESQMTAFFERLNAEEDPTRIATMAETMPDPPSLGDVAASIATPAAEATSPTPDAPAAPMEFDFAAAEAEAASFDGELDSEDGDPAPASADELEVRAIEDPAPSAEVATEAAVDPAPSRVIVSGLASVANIANFKRSLARIAGVSTIAVASGPDGDFVFTIGHDQEFALSDSVRSMTGFDIEITGESGDAINVAARDRDGTD